MSDEQWADELQRFHAEAYAYVYSLGGRLSGEHGIGAKKLPAMETYTNPVEMQIMRCLEHLQHYLFLLEILEESLSFAVFFRI